MQRALLYTNKLIIIFFCCTFLCSFKSTSQEQPKGYALLVAVPKVNNEALRKKYGMPKQEFYSDLPGACRDLDKMAEILKQEGFSNANIIRLGENKEDSVTEKDIVDALNNIGAKVKKNDLFVFYYSGHGTRVKDVPAGDEPDGKDEAIVAYNSYLLDDLLNSVYKKQFTATRNIMIMDACNAGSMFEVSMKQLEMWDDKKAKKIAAPPACTINATTAPSTGFGMLYFGASRDENYGYDTGVGGYFTLALSGIYHPVYWKTIKPGQVACKISTQMQAIHDPGNGKLQYTECGNLTDEFKNSHLFKIK